MPEFDCPADWQAARETIDRSGWRRVVVLGAPDVGKSTFCHWLAAAWPSRLLDSDLGQQSLGPPATIGLSGPGEDTRRIFIGSTSPAGATLPLLAGIAALAGDAGPARLLLNTSGMIGGPGEALKPAKLDAVRAEAVVALQHGTELEPLLAGQRHRPILRLRPSPLARRRSQAQRGALRREAFATALRDAVPLSLAPSDVALQQRGPLEPQTLCGLAGGDGVCLGLGLWLGRQDERWHLLSSVPAAMIRLVQVGRLRLTVTGDEVPQTQEGPRHDRGPSDR